VENKFVEKKIVYFNKAGRTNTRETLRLAAEEAAARGISKVLVASTTGETARRAAEQFAGTGIKLIIVPHQFGFKAGKRFPPELVAELEQQGHKVHFATMPFHTDDFHGCKAVEAMAIALRTICQGMKVCVEIVLMAADAGLVAQGEEVIAVSGTRAGADTAVVALASTTSRFNELHITEILCKPLKTRIWPLGPTPYDRPRQD